MGMRTVNRFDGRRFIEKGEPPKALPVTQARSTLDALMSPAAEADPDKSNLSVEQLTGGNGGQTHPPHAPGSGTPDPNAAAAPAGDEKKGASEAPDFEKMTKDELGVFIAKNGGEAPASSARKEEFVEAAKAAHAKAQQPPQE